MIQADEELQPVACFCILDERGGAAPDIWRNRPSLVTWPPSFSILPQLCHPHMEPTHHSTLVSLPSYVSECLKKDPWTRFILNMQGVLSFNRKDLNTVIQQAAVTKNPHNRFIIFCYEDTLLQLSGDTEDHRMSIWDTCWHISNSSAHWLHGPNTNTTKGIQHELNGRDNFNTCSPKSTLKSCEIYTAQRVLYRKEDNVKRKKGVSFDDEVIIYLFDQESPTMELHSGPCTSLQSTYSCNLSEVTLEDSGLEWEDDFSALEKSCHFQCGRQSVSQLYTPSLPTQSCTALSRRLFLSQTCLFLTHVTESDLEL
nr:uncharacterized protein LOC124052551 isoform X2 [Scatophagus argus]XP_046232904.1 uncharacterized protein LOC124052551 isoform X2 [Scatophagus argus]